MEIIEGDNSREETFCENMVLSFTLLEKVLRSSNLVASEMRTEREIDNHVF